MMGRPCSFGLRYPNRHSSPSEIKGLYARGGVKLDKPGVYRIKARGVLPDGWSDRLGGLHITGRTSEGTTLVSRLKDQAELSGVLNTLYELHLSLSSVEILSNEEPI